MARNREQNELLTTKCLCDAVDEFITVKKIEQKSPRTVRYYRDNLAPLLEFAGKDTDVLKLDTAALNRYLLFSQQLPGKIAHRRRYDCLRAFINHLVWMGYLLASPLRSKPPKVPTRIIEPFTPDQVQAMLDACKGRCTAARDKAMIMMLLDSAIRLDELARMRHADINWPEGNIYIMGKGNKERRVPVSTTTLKAVYRYLQSRKSGLDQLWLSEERRPLTRSGVQQIVRRISKKALGKSFGPHKFRHTYACDALMAGMPVESLMKILGHSSMKMSLEYAEYVRARHALGQAKLYSPVERLGVK